MKKLYFFIILVLIYSGCSNTLNKVEKIPKQPKKEKIDITSEVNFFFNKSKLILLKEKNTFNKNDNFLTEAKKYTSDLINRTSKLNSFKKNLIKKDIEMYLIKINNELIITNNQYKTRINNEKEILKNKINNPLTKLNILYNYLDDTDFKKKYSSSPSYKPYTKELDQIIYQINKLNRQTWDIDPLTKTLTYKVNEVKPNGDFFSKWYNKKKYIAIYDFNIENINNQYFLTFTLKSKKDYSSNNEFENKLNDDVIKKTFISFIKNELAIIEFTNFSFNQIIEEKEINKLEKIEKIENYSIFKYEILEILSNILKLEGFNSVNKTENDKIFKFLYLNIKPQEIEQYLKYLMISSRTYKNKRYLTFDLNSDVIFNNVNIKFNNNYKIAKYIFDKTIRKELKRNANLINGIQTYNGVEFTIFAANKNFVHNNNSELISYTYYLPKEDSLKYINQNITGQNLIDKSIILIDNERVDLILDR